MKFLTLLTVLKEEFFQTLKYRFQNISLWDDNLIWKIGNVLIGGFYTDEVNEQ